MLNKTLTPILASLQSPIGLSTWPEKQSEIGKQFFHSLTEKPPIPCQDGSFILDFSSDQTIPKIIQHIIEKMLMVREENRYLTQEGLVFDLQRCLNELNKTGKIDYFFPGMSDKPNQLIFHDYFFGRQQEIQELRQLYDEVCEGESKLVFVSGYSGVGKTAFVNVALKALASKKGFFISGKFDQYINKPYTAFVEALVLFCQAKPNQMLIDDIQKAVAPNGQVLVDLVPEFEALLGKQPEIQELDSDKGKNRFNFVLKQFFRTVADKKHPLVIFLDDLQWVDPSSLELIELLLENQSHLLIIGSFRSNEWNLNDWALPNHYDIDLLDLSLQDIEELLAHTFQEDDSHTKVLTQVIYDKAHGNPFFVKQMVQSMVDQNHIGFKDGAWHWKIDEIQKLKLADNVAKLMTDRLKLLADDTLNALQYAAFLGNKFSLKELAFILEKDEVTVELLLWDAIKHQLIAKESNAGFVFLHDKVQEGIYDLVQNTRKIDLHFHIGTKLSNIYINDDIHIIRIAIHMNYYLTAVSKNSIDKNFRKSLIKINCDAGYKAKLSSAYEQALIFFSTGYNLLVSEDWASDHEATLSLYFGKAECEFLVGSESEAVAIFDYLFDSLESKVARIQTYTLLINLRTQTNEQNIAVEIGKKALREFGIRIPSNHFLKIYFLIELAKSWWIIRKHSIEQLSNIKKATNHQHIALIRLMVDLGTSFYFTNKYLFSYLVLVGFRLVYKYGHCANVPIIYSAISFVLGPGTGNYQLGHELGQLSLNLNDKFYPQSPKARIYHVIGRFLTFWIKSYDDSIQVLTDSLNSAKSEGDLLYLNYAHNNIPDFMFFSGKPLAQIEDYLYKLLTYNQKYTNHSSFKYSHTMNTFLINSILKYRLKTIDCLNNYNEEQIIQDAKDNNHLILLLTSAYNMVFSYILNDFSAAHTHMKQAKVNLSNGFGTIHYQNYYFYSALIISNRCLQLSFMNRRSSLIKLFFIKRKLFKWSLLNPNNFFHQYILIQAEYARVKKKPKKAAPLYDQSIQSALQNGFIQNAAIAAECAGRFYLEQKNEDRAKKYLVQAKDLFGEWGAVAKVRQMEEVYGLSFDAR